MLKEIKEQHDSLRNQMSQGENYYNQQNEVIMSRQKLMGIKRGDRYAQIIDPYASNQQLASGFLKQIIKQKVNYLINEDMMLSDQNDEVTEMFENWKKDIKKIATKVSYEIYGAWQLYIEDGQLKKKFISGKQLYPIYNDEQDELIAVARFYKDGKTEKAIIYDNKTEKHYELDSSKWKLIEELPILKIKNKLGDDVIAENAVELPAPPFAFLFNNDEWLSDLQPIKSHIDVYDIVDSDFANNIIDFQDIYHTLKNYQGQDLAEFNQQLKILKTVPIGEDGEFTTHMAEVPVVAKQTYLGMKRKDIYEFAMAVDLKEIAAGNSTVVAIQSMFENLNMKAADFEQELQDFWRTFIKLVNFFNAALNINIVLDNKILFDKSMLMNEKEIIEKQKLQVETASLLMGVLDDETLIEAVSNLEFMKDNVDIDAAELLKRHDEKMAGIVIEEGE